MPLPSAGVGRAALGWSTAAALVVVLSGCRSSSSAGGAPSTSGPGHPGRGATPVAVRARTQPCAALSDGTLWCWGNVTLTPSARGAALLPTPVQVDVGGRVRAFDLAPDVGVAVLEGGELATWSWSAVGAAIAPRAWRRCDFHEAVDVAIDRDGRAFVRVRDGRLFTWHPTAPPTVGGSECDRSAMTVAPSVTLVTAVACGARCCAVHGGGSVTCFDRDLTPHPLPDVTTALAVSVDDATALIRLRDGRTLGASLAQPLGTPPDEVVKPDLLGTPTLDAHACAVTLDHRARCQHASDDDWKLLDRLGADLDQIAMGVHVACGIDRAKRVVCAQSGAAASVVVAF